MDLTLPLPGERPPRSARLAAALAAAHTAAWLSRRLTHGSGRAIGGRTLIKVHPGAPVELATGRTISLVTGTNGKSTTTAMLAAAVGSTFPTVSNTDGANTPGGLVTALAEAPADHAVLEVDEGWIPWTIKQLRPAVVVLLNLSRDQLHRHPEVLSLARAWREALHEVPLVVANADDVAVTWAAEAAQERIWVAAGQTWTRDSVVCPSCGGLLLRSEGSWGCGCGFRRPQPEWASSDGRLLHDGEELSVDLGVPGEVNLGNAALAIAAATALGVEPADAARAVGTVRNVAGRYARVTWGRHAVRLLLAKNPAGWDAALSTLEPSTSPLVLAFNSEGVDGRDPSWLYDVDFSRLGDRPIAVCGRRATDMLVRLRMDGLAPVGQFDSVDGALRSLPAGEVDVVANYSAFQEARRVLGDGA